MTNKKDKLFNLNLFLWQHLELSYLSKITTIKPTTHNKRLKLSGKRRMD